MTECEEKLKLYEKLMRAYVDNTENISNMRSSQNNIGFVNVGYDSNKNNGACDCGLGLWSILEILVVIALVIFVGVFLFSLLKKNMGSRKANMEKRRHLLLEEFRKNVGVNPLTPVKETTIEVIGKTNCPDKANCPMEHLHMH